MTYSPPLPLFSNMAESEYSLVGKAAAGVLAALLGGFGTWQAFRGVISKLNLTEANSEGNISAIQNLQAMLQQERTDHRLAIDRLDKFVNERNQVLQQLSEVTATMKIQSAKIEAQNEQIRALTSQIEELRGSAIA